MKYEIYDSRFSSGLLKDRTTGKNIIWATNDYEKNGSGFGFFDSIYVKNLSRKNKKVIVPRSLKSKNEQIDRIKNKAEVFTPSWMCNYQNNIIDDEWFGRKNVFNIENDKGWKTKETIDISFEDFVKYISLIRLEMSCGEAPYLTSRYDTVSSEYIEPKNRIGLLDRKLILINQFIDDQNLWIEYAIKALKSIYGYDWQGDNVFLARQNILLDLEEFYYMKFNTALDEDILSNFVSIITWNIWQMDGIKYVVPESCHEETITAEFDLFSGEETILVKNCKGCESGNNLEHNGKYCLIMDWEKEKRCRFVDLVEYGGQLCL